ncbi:MAG: hypothetical protein LBP78_08440 [Acidaminococcales bacterium]|jgi:septum formation inhibitor MinC|nr:hypothetical protein [Acidaminococcales bacterium]
MLMKDIVVLKGDRDGLFLVVSPERPFSDVLLALEEKLNTSSEFFIRTPTPPLVRYKGERCLTHGEGEQLCALLDRYGIIYNSDFPQYALDAQTGACPSGGYDKSGAAAGGLEVLTVAAAENGEEKNGHDGFDENKVTCAFSPLVFEMEMLVKENEALQSFLPPREDEREFGTDDLPGRPTPPETDGQPEPRVEEEFWLQPDYGVWAEPQERAAVNSENMPDKEPDIKMEGSLTPEEKAEKSEAPVREPQEQAASGGADAASSGNADAGSIPDKDNLAQANTSEGDMMAKSILLESNFTRQKENAAAGAATDAKSSAAVKEAVEEPVGNIVMTARQHTDVVNYESATRSVLTIYRTVRGGQEIRYNGSVIIFGDINPTARIFAENDIIVAGVTRGILYAGCRGDRSASIAAGSFSGGQIRIADLIVRAPDEPSGMVGFGVARIYNNQIEIHTIRR